MTGNNISDLTFEDLCAKIKQQYGNTLPESAYVSPKTLIEAMQRLKEDKPLHPYASGYSYHRNVLKELFFNAAVHYPKIRFTLNEVCEYGNLPVKKIRVMVSKWKLYGYPYLSELRKRTSKTEIVYKLRKAAYVYHLKYKNAMGKGFDLNLRQPKKTKIYVHINGCGRRIGLDESALPVISLEVTSNHYI
jgi:hypothetical protein